MGSGKTKLARQSLYMEAAFKQILNDRAKGNKVSFNKEVIRRLVWSIEEEEKQAAQQKTA